MHNNHYQHRHAARRHERPEHILLEDRSAADDAALNDSGSLANALIERASEDDGGVATVYSVVYVTASPTFSGSIAGYVTLTATSNTAKTTTTTKAAAAAATTTTTKSTSSASSTSSDSSSAASSSTTSSAMATSSVSSSSVSLSSSSSVSGTALAEATTSSAASASSTAAASSGLSSGAKGGIAFAVILALGLVAGLVFFFYRRKQSRRGNVNGSQRLDDNEKRAPVPAYKSPAPASFPAPAPVTAPAPAPALAPAPAPIKSVRTSSPAPRLSIRPTSRFSLGVDPEKAAAAIGSGALAVDVLAGSKDRRSANPHDPANPFGNYAETVNPSKSAHDRSESATSSELSSAPSEVAATSDVPPATPLKNDAPVMSEKPAESAASQAAPVVAASGGAAAAAAAAAAAGASALVNNVHRVQLEFKPSMDDELELKVGNLVRVLHEYDDGWALCMTMDRTRQGVAPRTCLSKLPLKPRPAGPPNGGRPMSPSNSRAPVTKPQSMRNVSEPIRPMRDSMVPAPLSPSVNGRMSPAGMQQQGRQRSNTASSQQARAMSPGSQPPKPMAGSKRRSASVGSVTFSKSSNGSADSSPSKPLSPLGVPVRKPVPGQAL